MQVKKMWVVPSLVMSFAVTAAHSVVPAMNLMQRNSCIVDGVPGDVDVRDGQAKTAICTWAERREKDDGVLQITLFAGQSITTVDASCQFTPAVNSRDIISDLKVEKGASIQGSLNLHANPITFKIVNNLSDPSLNVQFSLNGKQDIKSQAGRFIKSVLTWSDTEIDYIAGDTLTCTFRPSAS